MNTRTISIRLPDTPNFTAEDALRTLQSSVAELGNQGDFWSANIVATLSLIVGRGTTPVNNEIWNVDFQS